MKYNILNNEKKFNEIEKDESQGRTKQFSDTEGIGMQLRGFALGELG